MSAARPLPMWQRVAGTLCILLFVQKLSHDWPLGLAPNSLWLCHMANLAMGLGLLLDRPWLARMGVLWIVPGLPIWFIDVWTLKATTWSSVLSHFGGIAVAGVVLSCRCWVTQRYDWFIAWAGYLLCQQAARWWTPPALNVNLAHAIYPGSEHYFSSYGWYALAISVGMAALFGLTQWAIAALKSRQVRAPGVTLTQ
jgi:hypothetical protein